MKRFLVAALLVFGMLVVSWPAQADLNNGLVAYYPFNGNANDESGNGNHGVVNGATLATDRFGDSNSAYNFNGTSDYIEIGDLSFFSLNEYSILAWIKTNSISTLAQIIFSNYDRTITAQKNCIYLALTGNKFQFYPQKIVLLHRDDDDSNSAGSYEGGDWLGSNIIYPENKYTHIVAVRNSVTDTMKIYLNGVLDNSLTNLTQGPITESDYFKIGKYERPGFDEHFFNGVIDELRFYNRALSKSEIQQLYTSSSTGSTTCSIIINPDLSFKIPNATYDTEDPLAGSMDFSFYGNKGFSLLWKLGDVGGPEPSPCLINIAADLSFTLPSVVYDAGHGYDPIEMKVWFDYYGNEKGEDLWSISNYAIKQLEIFDIFINGNKYSILGDLSPGIIAPENYIFTDHTTWVESVTVLKNDTQEKLTKEEYLNLSKGIIRFYQPYFSSIKTEWAEDFGMFIPDCGSFFGYFTFDWPSTACLTTKWNGFNGLKIGDDSPERKKIYKAVLKDMISGISNIAGRGIVSLDDGMGNSINADALPSSYSPLKQFVDVAETVSESLGIVNGLLSLVKGGMDSDDIITVLGVSGKEADLLKNNITWLQSLLVFQQTGLSFSSKVAINQVLANFGQLLEYTNTLKISYEYVKTKVNPLIDSAMLTAIEELEDEILDSSNIVMKSLGPAIEAGYDNAQSILSSIISLTKFSDKFADLFVVKTNSVLQSSSDKLLAKQASVAAGSIINAALNTIFLVRDKSDTWEEIFVATHLHEILSEYHSNNPGFKEYVTVGNESIVKIDPVTADHLLVLFNLIDASALHFYDKFISLVDTKWNSVIMNTASDVLSGATTGTLLTPLPWFGSAVTWGSALGEKISCTAAKDQCDQLHDEAGNFRNATVNRHNVLNQWALLIKESQTDFVSYPPPSGSCGAFVSPGVWKEFDCYNLAAIGKTTNDDPFTPSWRLIGGYWHWGRKGPDPNQWYNTNTEHFAHGPTGPGERNANNDPISGWDNSYAPDGAWSDSSKTANDPCPAGYRVPTKSQWDGVLANNTQSIVGTWSTTWDDHTNYSSARFFGSDLMLPAAGNRNGLSGSLGIRGQYGFYWSSSESSEYYVGYYSWYLVFGSGDEDTDNVHRWNGMNVRCISE